jgi:hypothetical protein
MEHFRPSKTKTHRLSYAGKWDFAFDKSLSRPMARHRQQSHQATSERQIAVALLSLIAVQSRNLMVAHPGSGPALQFPSAVDVMKEP